LQEGNGIRMGDTLMKRLIFPVIAVLALSCSGCWTDRTPKHMMVEMAFFKCEKCHSLEGGVYGKGPTKFLHSPEAKNCVHNWQRISKEEFKRLATEWQGIDWQCEIPFWSR
jgi:hypothetical protein